MAFRVLFIVTYLVYMANFSAAFQLSAANVVEKGVALVTALVFLATRPVDLFVLAGLPIVAAMIVLLGFLNTNPSFEWGILINAMNQVFILFALLSGVPDRRDKEVLLPFIALVPIMSVALGFVYDAAGIKNAFGTEFATGVQRLGGSVIPAFLSGLAMCGVIASFYVGISRRPWFLILTAVNFMILLYAGGRAALAVTLIVCSLWMLTNSKILVQVRMMLSVAGMFAAFAMLAVVLERLTARFTGSGLNGRDLLWQFLWTVHDDHPYAGIGFGHQFFVVPDRLQVLTGTAAAHNDYLRLLVELGWFGVFVFYLVLVLMIVRLLTRRSERAGTIMVLAFTGYLILSYSDNVIAGLPYMVLLFVAYLTAANRSPVKAASVDAQKAGRPGLSLKTILPSTPASAS